MKPNELRLKVPEDRRADVAKALRDFHLVRECLGWNLFDELIIMPQIPKKGGKRLRKKKAKKMRLRFVMQSLKEAGVQVEKIHT